MNVSELSEVLACIWQFGLKQCLQVGLQCFSTNEA